jgi:hypothetical protein
MEINAKIPFYKLLTYAKLAKLSVTDIIPSSRDLDIAMPDNILKIRWVDFVDNYTNSSNILAAIELINVVTKIDQNKIAKMRSDKAYRVWLYYSQQFKQAYTALESINSEAGKLSKKQAKSMDSFGLLNITNFLCKCKNVSSDVVDNWTLGKILVEYKYEIYENVNIIESMKK